MANLLQVTTPGANGDNRNIIDPQDPRYANTRNQVQNPVDPTRVVRADGREDGKTGNAKDGAYTVLDYESNYGAFIQKLKNAGVLTAAMEKFLFSGFSVFAQADEAGAAQAARFLSFIQMASPEQLLSYLKGQGQMQAKFTGPLFDNLRALLSRNPSEPLKEEVLQFLRSYNDYTAGEHLLKQMRLLTDDVSRLMLRQFRGDFTDLADSMMWEAKNGDVAQNTGLLNGRLIPFLSSYIAKTHDYGPVRDASMLLIFYAIRYENGSLDELERLFERLLLNKEFSQNYQGDPRADLAAAVAETKAQSQAKETADTFASLMLRGASGEAGVEHIQQFYTVLNGLLLNESVYLPLIHLFLPFRYEDQQIMSELWIDPDAKREDEEDGNRRIKMYLKFDIQNVGKFDLVLAFQGWAAQMDLFVPPSLFQQEAGIRDKVGEILKKNGIQVKQLSVRERRGEITVNQVFPEIREKESTVNVRV